MGTAAGDLRCANGMLYGFIGTTAVIVTLSKQQLTPPPPPPK
jgi:hypothetical protein